MLHASLCAKIMVFRRITRIIGIVLNERTVLKGMKIFAEIEPVYYICSVKETNFVRLVKKNNEFSVRPIQWFS